jgi:hypothetical protein
VIGLFDWLKLGAGAIVGVIIGYQVGHWIGFDAGYDKRIAEEAVATAKADAERRGDDAKLQGLSDYDLCVTGLRASRMPIEPCSVLRGVGEE